MLRYIRDQKGCFMEHPVIRNVSPRDLPAIALLEAECFPGDPWSEKLLREAAVHPDTVFWVAEALCGKDGTEAYETVLAGYCILRTVLDEGSIDNICVAPAFRRQGIARALLEAAMEQAKAEYGATTFTLEVRISNEAARALYASLGFEEAGIRPGYYPHPREDAVIYRTK